MKKLIITLTVIALTTCVFGQTAKPDTTKLISDKWTIGTILMSESNSYLDKIFTPNFFNGIVAKKHLNYFTARLAFEYVKIIDEKDDYSSTPDFLYSDGFTKQGMIRLGIEKGITLKRNYRPYIAFDLTAIKSYSDKTFNGGLSGNSERVKTKTIGFGATPAIGFEVKLTKLISIALETRVQIIYCKSESNVVNLAFPTFSSGRQEEQWTNF
ncbi:MAG: hypothetical protein A3F72_12750 [Bacteroidetes bacterium RIFCSPLOWO2_12_FULL_35_15]|nr:MAG: hypothetical protein A3F72_12750 [Bacteroidetes bacterium RIFCSPLOWO2_12_FULL_35_15]